MDFVCVLVATLTFIIVFMMTTDDIDYQKSTYAKVITPLVLCLCLYIYVEYKYDVEMTTSTFIIETFDEGLVLPFITLQSNTKCEITKKTYNKPFTCNPTQNKIVYEIKELNSK